MIDGYAFTFTPTQWETLRSSVRFCLYYNTQMHPQLVDAGESEVQQRLLALARFLEGG